MDTDPHFVEVVMPPSEGVTELDTKNIMEKIGVTTPFNEQADFGTLYTNTYLEVMKEKVGIKVDKEGTTVAAASAAVGMGRRINETRTITVNRPFIMVVHSEFSIDGENWTRAPIAITVFNGPADQNAAPAHNAADTASTPSPYASALAALQLFNQSHRRDSEA
jgi:hypothetical protein